MVYISYNADIARVNKDPSGYFNVGTKLFQRQSTALKYVVYKTWSNVKNETLIQLKKKWTFIQRRNGGAIFWEYVDVTSKISKFDFLKNISIYLN